MQSLQAMLCAPSLFSPYVRMSMLKAAEGLPRLQLLLQRLAEVRHGVQGVPLRRVLDAVVALVQRNADAAEGRYLRCERARNAAGFVLLCVTRKDDVRSTKS